MGYGLLHGQSPKPTINIKSSTESGLVGKCKYFLYNILLMMFMDAQEYDIKNNILYQDNQSTMKILPNGRNSCTGYSQHINICFFC